MKFLGIDLGWSSGASGLCCLGWQDGSGENDNGESGKLELLDLQHLQATEDILAWIDTWVPLETPGIIAVDAPTLIPNATGMRLCDRLAHKHFGRYHAGCYPANLGSSFAQRTLAFGCSLEARGFHHAPTIQPQQPGRYQIEVFPHPATVHLFGLERILKYKKGKLAERRVELAKLQQYLSDRLPLLEPALELAHSAISLSAIPTKGTALKAWEDQLDSLTCAYVAAHWWYWGFARNWVLGNCAEGYIVVPAPTEGHSLTTLLNSDFTTIR